MQPITYRHRSRNMGKPWHWLLLVPVLAAWPIIRFMLLDWDRFAAFDWIAGAIVRFMLLDWDGFAVFDWTAGDWWGLYRDAYGWHSVVLFAFVIALPYWVNSPRRNFLLLDRVGLTYWKLGYVERQWCWEALSAFTLEANQSGPSHIVFTLLEGETIPVQGFRIGKTSQVRIEDIYDAPLEEIAARLNACREQALGAEPAQSAAPLIQPVIIRTEPSKGVWGALARTTHILMVLGVLVAVAWLLYEHSLLVPGEPLPDRLYGAFAALLGVVVPGFLLMSFQILPNYNQLRLDRDGLTVVRLGRKRRWSWRDLAIVDLHPGRGTGYFSRRGLMALAATGSDWPSRFLRRWYGLSAAGPVFIVEDTYAIPLERIAAKLNEYRDLALGGGPDVPERT